jgi:multiple sugar transport system ATP-binding protein
VAGFIGSPAMNFINVSLVEKESVLFAVADGFELPVPLEKKGSLQHLVNSEVILGIRPEHLEEKSFADKSAYKECISATVDVIETLGAEIQINVTAGGHALVARVDARMNTNRHENIDLAVNVDNIHFFEKDAPSIRIATEKR